MMNFPDCQLAPAVWDSQPNDSWPDRKRLTLIPKSAIDNTPIANFQLYTGIDNSFNTSKKWEHTHGLIGYGFEPSTKPHLWRTAF